MFTYLSAMTLDELQHYFQNHIVPVGTMLNKATKIVDPKQYLNVNFDNARRWPGDINKCPNYWHLCALYRVLNEAPPSGPADGQEQ